jgi:hypothetical protein
MKWLKLRLQIIGATSLILLAIGTVWSFHQYSGDRIDAAKPKDAQVVLNWGGIPTTQDFKVTASSESTRNFTGDHLDYFCIDLPKFELAETAKEEWQDGPEKNLLLADALVLSVNDARQHGSCIPPPEKANSADLKIMFWEVRVHGRYPNAADIIVV